MSFGILQPGRWKRQPAGPVEIDWRHPMTRGLRACFVASHGSIELVTRQALTNVGGSTDIGRFMQVGPGGRAYEDVQYDGPLRTSTGRSPNGWTQQLEIAGHVEILPGMSGHLGSSGFKHIISYTLTNNIGIGVGSVSGTLYPAFRTSELDDVTAGGFENLTLRFDASTAVEANKPFSLFCLITWSANTAPTNNAELQFGVSGRAEVTARYTVFGDSINAITAVPCAYTDQRANPLHRTYTAAWWDRRRPDAERIEYDRAPYQFLRPRTLRIYSLGAAGIPVLSGSTVIDIGQTSARPRVTITF